VSYRPREFWEQRLAEQFDLRGTGETGLSLAYNRACYTLRGEVLARALRAHGVELAGRRVLDVGCGTGFFTDYYLRHGAQVTGLDIAPTSVERLRARHPQATFRLGDVGEDPIEGTYDVVNAFDVLYHVTDDARWERAVRALAGAVAPGGVLLVTDALHDGERAPREAAHNVMRPLARYRSLVEPAGLRVLGLHPTHVLLNRELGAFRFLNRLPGLLLALDRLLLAAGMGRHGYSNHLLVARRG